MSDDMPDKIKSPKEMMIDDILNWCSVITSLLDEYEVDIYSCKINGKEVFFSANASQGISIKDSEFNEYDLGDKEINTVFDEFYRVIRRKQSRVRLEVKLVNNIYDDDQVIRDILIKQLEKVLLMDLDTQKFSELIKEIKNTNDNVKKYASLRCIEREYNKIWEER